ASISDIIIRELNESLEIAKRTGIDKERILLDPGVGFGKTYEDNVNTIKELEKICSAFDLPMLLGTSKKSVIGLTLGVDKSERLEGTLATTARAIDAGCLFVRVHDVKENARFIKMYETVARV
ncbi:MAG: dihydropteroate synthase, partial [Lachnospiraceae bacterium]|nr:dihydropteroate synthase [Lachnospiraceae bacterium]